MPGRNLLVPIITCIYVRTYYTHIYKQMIYANKLNEYEYVRIYLQRYIEFEDLRILVCSAYNSVE